MRHNLVEVVKKPLITLHDGEYARVSATKLRVCKTIENATGEIFNLILKYTKGDEDGLNLYVAYPDSLQDTEPFPRESGFETIGGGVLLHADLVRRFTSSTDDDGTSIPIGPNGKRYFTIYQIVQGSTAPTGKFQLYAEINSIAR